MLRVIYCHLLQNFSLLRSLLKDELHEDWSLPVHQTKAQKSGDPELISPPSIARNGIKSSKNDNKPGSKTAEKEESTNRKLSKENMSAMYVFVHISFLGFILTRKTHLVSFFFAFSFCIARQKESSSLYQDRFYGYISLYFPTSALP
jgi:hypothetical protein